MDAIAHALPHQFARRAATAQFMVDLESYYTGFLEGKSTREIVDMPIPPDHLDHAAVEDCRSISAMVALVRQTVYQVSWDAVDYANDVSKAALPNPDVEARLMAKYPPLIPCAEVICRQDDNLPLIVGPAIVTDVKGRILLWSLPQVLSDTRQAKILRDTRLLEGQMTIEEPEPGAKVTKGWRTVSTFYSKNGEWISGSTLLYPAGYQQGHVGSNFNPAPSADVRTTRAADWMAAFEENGGILDGILAMTHPKLYEAAQKATETIWREHSDSRAIMATWPSCFSALQVIINRSTLGHCDCHGAPGWFDLLVTLGTYGKKAVLELHGLGISLPYNAGTIVPLSSKLLLHGVPKVRGERVCYAFYMHSAILGHFNVPVDAVTYSEARRPRDHVLGHLTEHAVAERLRTLGLSTDLPRGDLGTSAHVKHKADGDGKDGDGGSEDTGSMGGGDDEDVEMKD
ncbi:hypothetical protein GSI_08467 [Ganoderma sinense ZZ0214-1]|uniref:2OGFeDO JBP1/TET oxygenase domain-containing protein n=1 Tax=Ganoderma sinense ZZ0214-1 TaxID=1077348 RepID=A0A2G8S3R9_9APHY|nr:hypothetical protein GSI_08467 [Ganoderma sinense ZZ0214-1]